MHKLEISVDGRRFHVDVRSQPGKADEYLVTVDGEELAVYLPWTGDNGVLEWMVIDNKPYELIFERNLHWVEDFSGRHALEIHDRLAAVARPISGDGRVKAPIPGLVTQVLVQAGDSVAIGQTLLVLEAMKMENEVRAPRAGTVKQVNVQPGKSVLLHELIIEIE